MLFMTGTLLHDAMALQYTPRIAARPPPAGGGTATTVHCPRSGPFEESPVRAIPTTLSRPFAVTRSLPAMALGSLLFAVLTAASSAVAFPLAFSPVPITLQTLVVILSGAMLGPLWGPVSQILYLGAGTTGMPVFAGGAGGPGVLAGPTGGYLIGFVIAAWTAGLFLRPGASWLRITAGLLLAHVVVFLFGVSHLMVFIGSDVGHALDLGVIPFLPGMVFKTAVAAAILRRRTLGWFRE
jgi:biotin transport system substrate-specific component